MLDLFKTSKLFTTEERQIQVAVRAFLEKEALPFVKEWWVQNVFPSQLISRFGELGLLGANIPDIEDRQLVSNVAHGLIMYELERIDSGLRSFVSVQGALVMYPIYRYGSSTQVANLLPKLARGEIVGCFGLTEHDAGSDPSSMRTRAHRDGNEYILNGTKMWISNGEIADIGIIWAIDQENIVRGFVVDMDSNGVTCIPIAQKMSMRTSVTSELILDNVRVPCEAMLPKGNGLAAPLSCLTQARYGIAWGALGALEAVYLEALMFSKNRFTFGKPIAARQLVQAKLTRMLSDHTQGLLMAWRLGKLKDDGDLVFHQVCMAKRDNVRSALNAARVAREILGGVGITTDYHAIRHMLNLETVDTYEGTYDIHTLIIGREITGFDALH